MHVMHWFNDNINFCFHNGLGSNEAIVDSGKRITSQSCSCSDS